MSQCLDYIDPFTLLQFQLNPHRIQFIPSQNHHHRIRQIEIQLCYASMFQDLSLLLGLLDFVLAYYLSVQVLLPFQVGCHRENMLNLSTYVLKELPCCCFILPYSLEVRVVNFSSFHANIQSLFDTSASVMSFSRNWFAFVFLIISPSPNLRLSSAN